MPNGLPAEFDEDASAVLVDFSGYSNCSTGDELFTYSDKDIDSVSNLLGIPWEKSKTIPFTETVIYLGFEWNIAAQTISIPTNKKEKYKSAIEVWQAQALHTLEEAQKLYGKLLHASNILPAGCAYLTSLETFMGTFSSNPFAPHHPPRCTAADLNWWLNKLNKVSIS